MRHQGRHGRGGLTRTESVLVLAAVGIITLMAIDVLSQPVESDVALYAVTPVQASMDRIEVDIEQREERRHQQSGVVQSVADDEAGRADRSL